ncbi:MAG: hypothetical protein IBX52_02600 [Bacterioplanes sp.]|nr:hypothetical protein [Bacterioplanes sp.]
MSTSRQVVDNRLFEFDQGYHVSYVNYSRANEICDGQLLLTLSRACERRTFVFTNPQFHDVDKNLVTSRGLYISAIKSSLLGPNRVEVGDIDGGFAYFSAKRVKEITPSA